MHNISVCVTEMGFTSLFIGGRVENSYVLILVMSGVVCSWAGSSCRFVVLDDAGVSLLDRYKSFISWRVIVAGGEVLSVCVCVRIVVLVRL